MLRRQRPGCAAGVVEQEQRQQAERLGVVGQQGADQFGEADRLDDEIDADEVGVLGGGVALREDCVDDAAHACQALVAVRRPRGRGMGCPQS